MSPIGNTLKILLSVDTEKSELTDIERGVASCALGTADNSLMTSVVADLKHVTLVTVEADIP